MFYTWLICTVILFIIYFALTKLEQYLLGKDYKKIDKVIVIAMLILLAVTAFFVSIAAYLIFDFTL